MLALYNLQAQHLMRPLQGVLLISDIFRIFWVWN
jgi:hypothetical protein